MKTIVTFITDLIFPPSADELCIRKLSYEDFKVSYQPRTIPNGVALCVYAHRQVSAAIHLGKFHNHPHAVALLADVLALHLDTVPPKEHILIPLPLSKERYRARGYNQVAEVATRACKNKEHIRIRLDLLAKDRTTAPQTSLGRKERLKNQINAFVVRAPLKAELLVTPVLLVDDVYTTGATMHSAYAALREAGFSDVSCIALSH